MGESNSKHLNRGWIAAACAAALLAPSLAQAERHRVRRSLPAGAVARTTPLPQSAASGTNAAVLAGVDRLRRSFEAAGGQAANGASLFQTPGGYIRSLSAPAGQVWTVSSFPGADRDPGGAALSFLRDNRVALGWSKRGRACSPARFARTGGAASCGSSSASRTSGYSERAPSCRSSRRVESASCWPTWPATTPPFTTPPSRSCRGSTRPAGWRPPST